MHEEKTTPKVHGNMKAKTGGFFAGIMAGGLIGAGLALLYAPKAGKETREDIKKKVEELKEEAAQAKEKAMAKAKDLKEETVTKVKEFKEGAMDKVDDYKDRAKRAVDELKNDEEVKK